VCIDTCHSYAAGYEIKTAEGFVRTFKHFEDIIGIKYLKGMHLNDTKKDFGTRVDRHEVLGKGFLGVDVFSMIMNDARFDNMPLILETPDESLWASEIKWLYSLEKEG
jgi:deoxyribonuclease-4